MKSLSTVLEDTKLIAKELEPQDGTLSTPKPISMESIGPMNTQSSLIAVNPKNMQQQPPEDKCEQKTLISETPEDKKKLTALVKACYESLNTYGKSPEQLEATIMLMQMTLGRFPYETVRAAFGTYLQGSSDMPKPADIIKIIEPPTPKREWCKVTFLEIKRKKRENVFTTRAEDKYLEDFMAAKTTAPEEERLLIENTLKQDSLENKTYWLED